MKNAPQGGEVHGVVPGLNLALCHDKQGKSATAWAEYLLAARMARTQGKAERAKAAEQYASALEPKLSYLTITVSSKVPGLVIRRGGTELDESAIGSRHALDRARLRRPPEERGPRSGYE